MDDNLGFILIIIRATIIVVIFIAFIIFLLFFIKYNTDVNGTHSGIVTAVEQSGYFYQNYIVYFKTNSTSSQEDMYCIPQNQTDLANELRLAQESQKEITLHYTGVKGLGLNLCGYDQITSVDIQGASK